MRARKLEDADADDSRAVELATCFDHGIQVGKVVIQARGTSRASGLDRMLNARPHRAHTRPPRRDRRHPDGEKWRPGVGDFVESRLRVWGTCIPPEKEVVLRSLKVILGNVSSGLYR